MNKGKPEVRVHLWMESEDGVVFGSGRAQLLRKIEELGSLRKAAEELGMSYRAAWGKIKRTEEVLGFDLIEKEGGNKKGYRLTEAGRALMEKFDIWHEAVERDALLKARELFTWPVTSPPKGRNGRLPGPDPEDRKP